MPAPESAAAKPFVPAPEDLLTEDLLALVSGSDRARDLFGRYGIRDLQVLSQNELVCDGLAPDAARRLAGAFELARRLVERRITLGQPLASSGAVHEAFRDRLRHLRVEQFWVIALDAKNRVLREVMISQGTLTSSLVQPSWACAGCAYARRCEVWQETARVEVHRDPFAA